VDSKDSWNNPAILRLCGGKEANMLWSHHEETIELPGKGDYTRNSPR